MASLSNRCSVQWGGEVFVGPSDNLGSDGAAATWRWNVNTFRLSAAPPHICLHPSPHLPSCLSRALRRPRSPHIIASSITPHSSKPRPPTRIRRSSHTREDFFFFYRSFMMMLLLHFASFSFPPVKLLSSSFCSSATYSSPGALFIMSVHWFPILWNRQGLASICRPFHPPSTGATGRDGRAC